ncbi:AraC family transcriptional regulator [Erwinia endophytica]|uniref:helix-turn-helix domain-containing protein n=1 Tax=Erwinia endophytica TaxID=1563158 RepID=UPI001265E7CD|nr:AraC family transcriptional regulator [Erwinia endophytica]
MKNSQHNIWQLSSVNATEPLEGQSVNTIALEMGYDSGSSFSTWFHRVTGEPPSVWLPSSQRRGKPV